MSYGLVKNYMERIQALKAEHGEAVYAYQVDLGNESRLSGCEMNIRVLPRSVVLTAVLPITLRVEEHYGIACRLAKYNRNRLNREEVGVFELNYLRNRIQFMLEVTDLNSEEELCEQIDYCLGEVKRYSETMLHAVCEESDAVYEAEREKIENERKEAERIQRTRQYRNMPVMGKLMSFLGIIDDEIEDDTLCLSAPAMPEEPEKKEESAEKPVEKANEEAKETAEEKTEQQDKAEATDAEE